MEGEHLTGNSKVYNCFWLIYTIWQLFNSYQFVQL
jgi:hypothetical protein